MPSAYIKLFFPNHFLLAKFINYMLIIVFMKHKIVVTQKLDLSPDQIKRLKSFGQLIIYNDFPESDEWIKRCSEGDIICSGKFGITASLNEIKDKFFSVPFVNIGWIDKNRIKKNKVTVSYAPGCNKDAVSEWAIAMMLNLSREFPKVINSKNISKENALAVTKSITKKNITILGKGNIGSTVAKICASFGMNITFFKRGDNLIESVKDADYIVNTLSINDSTKGILDRNFFKSIKKGSYFISIAVQDTYDSDAMIEALDNGTLAGAADDCGGSPLGEVNDPFYQKLLKHPKILVTSHVAALSDLAVLISNDMMIDNIEAWINKKPINIVE
jgi:glycerate dehydrogenase